MTQQRTIADQMRILPARLNWTLTTPTGDTRRGEEIITESEWLDIVKQLAKCREGHLK